MKKAPHNPFLLLGYHSRKYFCNRNDEINWLEDNLQNGRNSVLYSLRRLGKTAVIQCVLKELERSGKAEVIFVDLLATQTAEDAILQIARAVVQRYGKATSGAGPAFMKMLGKVGFDISIDPMTGLPSLSMGLRQGPSPEHSLESLGTFLKARKKPVVIAMDEFQQVCSFKKENAEAIFRTWAQQFPEIRFIFSGSHRQMMMSMFAEKNRPFYRSAQLKELQPIALDEYRPFISKHFKAAKKNIDRDVVDEIYRWSRGQTYCVQLLCNRLYGSFAHADLQALNRVKQEVLQQENNVFINYFNLFTTTQWNVLRAIAKEEPLVNPLSKEVLMRHQLGAASTVASALKQLQHKEFVVQLGDEYLVHDVVFARWLRHRG